MGAGPPSPPGFKYQTWGGQMDNLINKLNKLNFVG